MAVYTYLACDAKTGAVLAELPLTGVSFGRVLNGAGTLSAELPVTDPRLSGVDLRGSTMPGRTQVFVDRDGVIVWGGMIWGRVPTSSASTVRIDARETWSYFERRPISWTTSVYTATDQATIANDLMTKVGALANLGIVVPAAVATGVLRTVAYYYYQFTSVAQAMQDLAAMSSGFDFAIDAAYSSGVITETFTFNYPRRGAIAASTGLMFDMPGNIISYSLPEDGSRISTNVYALGAGTADAMLISSSASQPLTDAGYPRLDLVQNYKDQTSQAALDARAISDAAMFSQPVITGQVTVRADADPILGSYTVGDEARFRITDNWFPQPTAGGAGLDTYYRIVGYTVTPGEGGQYETVTLNLGPTLT